MHNRQSWFMGKYHKAACMCAGLAAGGRHRLLFFYFNSFFFFLFYPASPKSTCNLQNTNTDRIGLSHAPQCLYKSERDRHVQVHPDVGSNPARNCVLNQRKGKGMEKEGEEKKRAGPSMNK